jgi:hypothetical protein
VRGTLRPAFYFRQTSRETETTRTHEYSGQGQPDRNYYDQNWREEARPLRRVGHRESMQTAAVSQSSRLLTGRPRSPARAAASVACAAARPVPRSKPKWRCAARTRSGASISQVRAAAMRTPCQAACAALRCAAAKSTGPEGTGRARSIMTPTGS